MRCRFLHMRRSAIVLQVRDLVKWHEGIMVVRVGGGWGGDGGEWGTNVRHEVQAQVLNCSRH